MALSHSVIVAARRLPIGRRNGFFKDYAAHDLGGALIRTMLAECYPILPDKLFMGNMIGATLEPDGATIRPRPNPAQESLISAGYVQLQGITLNRACSSGLEALREADTAIRAGDQDIVIAGGMESMSGFPHEFIELLLQCPPDLKYPAGSYMMYEAGEWCAEINNIRRRELDAFAMESYCRAYESFRDTRLRHVMERQIIPFNGHGRDEGALFIPTKENIRKAEPLRGARKITKYSASLNADGAALCVMMSETSQKRYCMRPLARIVCHDSVQTIHHDTREFTVMPPVAIRKVLKKAGLMLSDIDIFEINIPFASTGIYTLEMLGIPRDRVNILGDSLSVGHPVGASGTILAVRAVHILNCLALSRAIICLCHALGGATAMIIENPLGT